MFLISMHVITTLDTYDLYILGLPSETETQKGKEVL